MRQAQTGRSYWKVRDDTNMEWTCWQPNAAVAANNAAGTGQLMMLGVRIAPAKDPQYGMNYSLLSCSPAPMGAQPTPAGAEQQVAAQPMPMQPQTMPPQPQLTAVPGIPPMPVPQPAGALPSGPVKTLGQGGNFSDADITRMARSTAVEAATQLAIAFSPDFSDPEGNFDWMKYWLAAEAISKHIVHRAHEGWVPGVEMEAPQRDGSAAHEQQVLAEIQTSFDAVEVPAPPTGVPAAASAEHAEGGEIDWSNP